MKKSAALVLLLPLCFCGCEPSGSAAELTSCSWTAELEGGGSALLRFDGDFAALTLKNGGESEEISGRFLADGSELIIFDGDSKSSYSFAYTPKGETLDLTRGGSTLTFCRKG